MSHQLGSLIDVFSTLLDLAGITPPKDRVIDGVSLKTALLNASTVDRYIQQTHPWQISQCYRLCKRGTFLCSSGSEAAVNYQTSTKLGVVGSRVRNEFPLSSDNFNLNVFFVCFLRVFTKLLQLHKPTGLFLEHTPNKCLQADLLLPGERVDGGTGRAVQGAPLDLVQLTR